MRSQLVKAMKRFFITMYIFCKIYNYVFLTSSISKEMMMMMMMT